MSTEILKRLGRFLSFEPERKREGEARVRREEKGYKFRPDREYEIVGGKDENLQVKCSSCGGAYGGPLATKCSYCGTARAVFYREAGSKSTIFGEEFSPEKVSAFPRLKTEQVRVGNYGTRERAFGECVSIGSGAEVNLVFARERAEIGVYTAIDVLVAPKVKTGAGLEINEAIVREAAFGDYSDFGLVVVTPGGNVTFRPGTSIETLAVGPDVRSISLGVYCNVRKLKTVGIPSIVLGAGSEIGDETDISLDRYNEIIQGVLEKLKPR